MAGYEWEVRYQEFQKRMETNLPHMYGEGKLYGGFCIGEGWWPLVEKLSIRISEHVKWRNGQRERLLEKNPYGLTIPEPIPEVVIQQIKEKFGGLRFYFQGGDEYIRGMVDFAEEMSYNICEECGEPGKKRNTGWIRTLCDHHYKMHHSGDIDEMDSNS